MTSYRESYEDCRTKVMDFTVIIVTLSTRTISIVPNLIRPKSIRLVQWHCNRADGPVPLVYGVIHR